MMGYEGKTIAHQKTGAHILIAIMFSHLSEWSEKYPPNCLTNKVGRTRSVVWNITLIDMKEWIQVSKQWLKQCSWIRQKVCVVQQHVSSGNQPDAFGKPTCRKWSQYPSHSAHALHASSILLPCLYITQSARYSLVVWECSYYPYKRSWTPLYW